MSDLILRANLLSISLISGAASARAKEQPVTVDCVSPHTQGEWFLLSQAVSGL